MMLIPCPWCGERDLHEFHCGGEAHIVRPADPEGMTDEQWADYVFMRRNPKGRHRERWHHVHGCRRWFNLVRDTVSDRVLAAYRMGEAPPDNGGTPSVPNGGTPSSPDGGTPSSPDGETP